MKHLLPALPTSRGILYSRFLYLIRCSIPTIFSCLWHQLLLTMINIYYYYESNSCIHLLNLLYIFAMHTKWTSVYRICILDELHTVYMHVLLSNALCYTHVPSVLCNHMFNHISCIATKCTLHYTIFIPYTYFLWITIMSTSFLCPISYIVCTFLFILHISH